MCCVSSVILISMTSMIVFGDFFVYRLLVEENIQGKLEGKMKTMWIWPIG